MILDPANEIFIYVSHRVGMLAYRDISPSDQRNQSLELVLDLYFLVLAVRVKGSELPSPCRSSNPGVRSLLHNGFKKPGFWGTYRVGAEVLEHAAIVTSAACRRWRICGTSL